MHLRTLNKKEMKLFDKVVGVTAVIYPLTGIPQVVKIWTEKSAAGLSLISWSFFLLVTLILITYSITKKEKKLALMWSLWVIMYIGVISGIIVYG
jgi:uncharacterized protein with PQ loop repeat